MVSVIPGLCQLGRCEGSQVGWTPDILVVWLVIFRSELTCGAGVGWGVGRSPEDGLGGWQFGFSLGVGVALSRAPSLAPRPPNSTSTLSSVTQRNPILLALSYHLISRVDRP